jgi:hypothetical protein
LRSPVLDVDKEQVEGNKQADKGNSEGDELLCLLIHGA